MGCLHTNIAPRMAAKPAVSAPATIRSKSVNQLDMDE